MKQIISKWIERYFSNEEALFLFILISAILVVILTLGQPLAPVFAGLILAFLMQGGVNKLKSKGMPHLGAVSLVFVGFVSVLLGLIFIIMPLAWKQLVNLSTELPGMFQELQASLLVLPEHYPGLVTEDQIRQVIGIATQELTVAGQWVVTYSLNSLGTIVALLIYLVLVPILVFFFLKDGRQLVSSWTAFLPSKRKMMTQIWHEMDDQIAN